MCSVLVIHTFGFMMMVVMRRKVKIISEETFGRRYLPTKYFLVGTFDVVGACRI